MRGALMTFGNGMQCRLGCTISTGLGWAYPVCQCAIRVLLIMWENFSFHVIRTGLLCQKGEDEEQHVLVSDCVWIHLDNVMMVTSLTIMG